jgi:hypothetical protein
MEYIIAFVLGMLTATLLIRWVAQRIIQRLLDQVEKELPKDTDNKLSVNLEFEQDIYFLYNNEDGSFIAQGNDLAELKQHLNQRFPNRTIAIVNGDPVALKNLGQQIKEFNENSNSVGSTP